MAIKPEVKAWLESVWKRMADSIGRHPLIQRTLDWIKGEFLDSAANHPPPPPITPPQEETNA